MQALYPQFAGRDCGHCLKFWYDDTTPVGQLRRRNGPEGPGTGPPIERSKGNLPLCQLPAGCPKGTPERQRSLSAKNLAAWRHYLECSATGRWPDDAIVRRNAGLVQSIEHQLATIDRWRATIRHESILDLVVSVLQARTA